MSEWISVKKRLPENHHHVLLYWGEKNKMAVGYRCDDEWQHWPIGSYAADGCLFGITHWMPLPSPPKPEPENTSVYI